MFEAEQAAEEWEVAKENFQPLKRGRDTKALEQHSKAPKSESEEVEARQRCENTQLAKSSTAWPYHPHTDKFSIMTARAAALSFDSTAVAKFARRAFWQELAAYQGTDPLEIWLRFAAPPPPLPSPPFPSKQKAADNGATPFGSCAGCLTMHRPRLRQQYPRRQIYQVDLRGSGGRLPPRGRPPSIPKTLHCRPLSCP